MNAEPHTHIIKIGHEYGSAGGWLEVTYGDTTVKVCPRLLSPFGCFLFKPSHPSERRIHKAVVKAIRRHDLGSRKAGQIDSFRRQIESKYQLSSDQWASETALK